MMTAPSSRGRSALQASAAWWVLIVGGTAFVLLQIVLLILRTSEPGGSVTLPIIALVTTGIPVCVVIAIGVWSRPQATRLRALRGSYPDALVLGVQMNQGTGYQIGELMGMGPFADRTYLGSLVVIVADAEGIGFWKGTRHPEQKLKIPWGMVDGITQETTVLGRPLPTVVLGVHSARWTGTIAFAPSREGWRTAFAELKPAVAIQLAAKLSELRQRTSGG